MVNDLLVLHFPQIVDINFTAKMEEDLDRIAEMGQMGTDYKKNFTSHFTQTCSKKETEVEKGIWKKKLTKSARTAENRWSSSKEVWKIYGLLRLSGMQNHQAG